MGSFFKPDIDAHSTLTPWQEQIQKLLGGSLGQMFGGGAALTPALQQSLVKQLMGGGVGQKEANVALRQILRGDQQTENIWNRSVLQPSLRAFDQEIAPRISDSFASHGASFSSRRGATTANALEGVMSSANAQLAGMVEAGRNRQLAAIGIPLQQTLGQISGFGGLNQAIYGPALQFTGQQTQALTSTPGVGQQGLQLAGGLLGFGGK